MKRILVIRGKSQYDSTTTFVDTLVSAFRKMSITVDILNMILGSKAPLQHLEKFI